MPTQRVKGIVGFAVVWVVLLYTSMAAAHARRAPTESRLDRELAAVLRTAGFTGRIEATLEGRIGRRIDPQLADLGRMLWFDTITGLNNDNTCAGCHSPTNGFGDTQSIAIGIDNNGVVGPHRAGPRNMRRTPMVINTAFFPKLMWNSRFAALSGNPFDNSAGFLFPPPEGLSLSHQPHLLVAQAFIPPTERTEVAGFDFPGDNDAHAGRGAEPPESQPCLPQALRQHLSGSQGTARRSPSTCSGRRLPNSNSPSPSPMHRLIDLRAASGLR